MSTLSASGRRLTGHAVVFDSESVDLGGFVERIAPEALDRTKAEQPDLRALYGHDRNLVLGRSSAGTLTYDVDAKGLHVAIYTPDTQVGRDTAESVRRKDVDGMSFSFTTHVDDWEVQRGKVVRTLRDISISEVSVVSFPAYPSTSVAVRSTGPTSNADDDGVERWNVGRTTSQKTADALRVKLAKLVASGKAQCGKCHRATGVAVRCDTVMCRGCLDAGDRQRAQQFRAANAGSSPLPLMYAKQKLVELL